MSLRETYQACKTLMAGILSSKGISANNQMGLTTLINKIRQLPSLDKTTVLSINVPLNLTYSDDFNISGTLLWDNLAVANKTVSLKVGNTIVDTATTNNYGEYSFTTSPVSMGTHSFQVVFDGDSNYDASESSIVTREIGRETSLLSITSNHNTGYNPSDTINVVGLLVSDDAEAISGASVKIYDGENTLIDTLTTDNTGAFSKIINGADLNTGDNLFNIVFDGDTYYTASSTSLTLRVSVASTMTVGLYDSDGVAIDTVSLHGQNNTGIIKAVVYDQLGNVVVGETVNFNVGGVITSAVTDNTGVAEYTYTAQSVADTGEVSVIVSCGSLVETCTFIDVFYTNICGSSEYINDYTSVPVAYQNTTNSSNTINYNSTENAWELKGSGRYQSGRLIPDTHNLDNVRVKLDFKLKMTHTYCQIGILAYNTATDCYGINVIRNQIRRHNANAMNTLTDFTDKYYTLELIKSGNTLTGNIYDGDTLLGTIGDETISLNSWDFVFFIWTEGGTNYITWIKNIRVVEL